MSMIFTREDVYIENSKLILDPDYPTPREGALAMTFKMGPWKPNNEYFLGWTKDNNAKVIDCIAYSIGQP